MTDPIVSILLVNPQFTVARMPGSQRQYPKPIIAEPASMSVMNPMPGAFAPAQGEIFLLPAVFEKFREVAQAILAFSPVLEETNPKEKLSIPTSFRAVQALRNTVQNLQQELEQIVMQAPETKKAMVQKQLLPLLEELRTFAKPLERLWKSFPIEKSIAFSPGPSSLPSDRPTKKKLPIEGENRETRLTQKPSVAEPIFSETQQFSQKQGKLWEALIRNFPPMLASLVQGEFLSISAFPPEVQQVLQQYVQSPVLQPFVPLPKETGESKTLLTTQKATPFSSAFPGEGNKVMATAQRAPVAPATIPLQVIQKVYPYYLPSPQLPLSAFVSPSAIAKGELLSLPVIPQELPFVRPQIFHKPEEGIRIPPFSTDIPFAFIVPYYQAYAIENRDFSAMPANRKVREEGDEEDAEGLGDRGFQLLSYIPEGDSLYGDPFQEGSPDEMPLRKLFLRKYGIGVYPVTNVQFVDFLNLEAKARKLTVSPKGEVLSSEGRILCLTRTGQGVSDIEVVPYAGFLGFRVVVGKESYPVVFVSYWGAQAFCAAGGFRLPTEAEWEKAASIKMEANGKVGYKFRFGCGGNDIDQAYANYEGQATTPVGFYNGISVQTIGKRTIQTSEGRSPFGCYDMSGNVWEWTSTGAANKIVKGGCYQSLVKDLRVSARYAKNPDVSDGFTGFRVAL